jgi:hypothetical protein
MTLGLKVFLTMTISTILSFRSSVVKNSMPFQEKNAFLSFYSVRLIPSEG